MHHLIHISHLCWKLVWVCLLWTQNRLFFRQYITYKLQSYGDLKIKFVSNMPISFNTEFISKPPFQQLSTVIELKIILFNCQYILQQPPLILFCHTNVSNLFISHIKQEALIMPSAKVYPLPYLRVCWKNWEHLCSSITRCAICGHSALQK